MRVVTSDQVQVESRILSLRFARVQSQSSRFMQDETGTEEGEASGLPLIHGGRLLATQLRSLAARPAVKTARAMQSRV